MTGKHLSLGMILLCGVAVMGQQPAAPHRVKLPEGEGKQLVLSACVQCHAADNITAHKLDRKGWENVVENMVQLGAKVEPEQMDTIVDYLAKNFAKPKTAGVKERIDINKATAQQLESQLGLSDDEAQSVVAYRSKHGNFKTAEELEKVPGIAVAKIEEKRDALVF